ncbi:hypothetical protein BJY00DRAFT_310574 [Aspergillus carlsbadensis]|nr:hypothetical protein BJY00DRAFT_310574 [Aspergillus carlsbadensis]
MEPQLNEIAKFLIQFPCERAITATRRTGADHENLDHTNLVFGLYPPYMYMAAGHPMATATDPKIKPSAAKAVMPDVELPLYKHSGHVPAIGDMAQGYTAISGWLFEAAGTVVDVEHPAAVNHPSGALVWVEPMHDCVEHFVIPYHTPELAMFSGPASWNWDIPRNSHKPLPGVGEVADGIWVLPDRSCFVGRGRVVKVQCEPYRVVFIEPESREGTRSQ